MIKKIKQKELLNKAEELAEMILKFESESIHFKLAYRLMYGVVGNIKKAVL